MKQSSKHNRAWRKRNPAKVKAHWTVNEAKRKGKLQPLPCAECGKPDTHAHHEDYSKPLDVRWLCHTCHARHHGREKQSLTWHERHYQSKPRPSKKGRLLAQAQALQQAGYSYAAIGQQLHISKGTAYKWLNTTPYS